MNEYIYGFDLDDQPIFMEVIIEYTFKQGYWDCPTTEARHRYWVDHELEIEKVTVLRMEGYDTGSGLDYIKTRNELGDWAEVADRAAHEIVEQHANEPWSSLFEDLGDNAGGF